MDALAELPGRLIEKRDHNKDGLRSTPLARDGRSLLPHYSILPLKWKLKKLYELWLENTLSRRGWEGISSRREKRSYRRRIIHPIIRVVGSGSPQHYHMSRLVRQLILDGTQQCLHLKWLA